jgi:hypothetical protein
LAGPLTCKVGVSLLWDAIAYVRGQIEDTTAPFLIPDATLALYVEAGAEEFSKWEPLGEHVVGTFGVPTPSSPLATISGISRYSCTVGNGFIYPVAEVTDVLFKASGIFNAASEMSYMALMAVTPFNWFYAEGNLLARPSDRIIRSEMLNELDHYGGGYWGLARDANGVRAIDIYPVPTSSGTPIFVRYTSSHQNVPDGSGNPTYPTIPENLKRYFGKFCLIEVLSQEEDRLAKSSQLKAGVTQRWSTPGAVRSYREGLKSDLELAMGSAVTVGRVSN